MDAITRITVDASDIAIDAALEQVIEGDVNPLAFFLRKLTATQTRYSTFDRELLAVYETIRHFRYFLEGRTFHIQTDHKPLTTAMKSLTEKSPRQSRHLSFILEFTNDIRHIQGCKNEAADALSRIEIDNINHLKLPQEFFRYEDFEK